jgi:2-aminoethylphosphonate-pyruvate transaminase
LLFFEVVFMEARNAIKRNVLLNPGPGTTTDTVKLAQVVPDICPREREFGDILRQMRRDLVEIVHGDPEKYTAVLFCGSGTVNIDVIVNSLLPDGKKLLVVNNGAYSSRAVEVARAYHLPHIDLKFAFDELPDLAAVEKALEADPDIALVYTTHNETGTGIKNPIREIGEIAHRHGAVFAVDTTSTYALLPIDIERDNVDFLMASAQKGLMSMTGLSFVIGREDIIRQSAQYPTRSYYTNLFLQYDYFEKTGEMHFTPPVQTVYATKQAIIEYFAEGEMPKYERHLRVWGAIHEGLERLGFRDIIRREWQSGMVVSIKYPIDSNWDFTRLHDYCYERGFTIYPGKVAGTDTFRLCSLGAIDAPDIADFFTVFEAGLREYGVAIPIRY